MKSVVAFLIAGGLALLLGACTATAPAPSGKPTVRIDAPSYGTSVNEGDTLSVQSVSTDVSGIIRVIDVDGLLANTHLGPVHKGRHSFQ